MLNTLLVAPPLSVDEVLKAVKGVNWRRLGEGLIEEMEVDDDEVYPLGYTNLDRIQDEYEFDEARLRAVVEEFFRRRGRKQWTVIWALYFANEIDKAQQIRSYAEPLEGMLLCDPQVLCTLSRPYWRRVWSVLYL